MNGNDLLNAMENVEDKHILAAEKRPKKRALIIPVLSAAAAAVIAVTGIAIANRSTLPKDLPKISAELGVVPSGGNGSGNIGSFEESANGNPWRESMKLKTLPVYSSSTLDPDRDYMFSRLESVVKAFGEDMSSMEQYDSTLTEERRKALTEKFKEAGAPDEEVERMLKVSAAISEVHAYNERVSFRINSVYDISVLYENGDGITIPDEYLAAAPEKSKTERMAEYVFENYGELIGVKDPVLLSADDNKIEFYAGGTEAERIRGYGLSHVEMYFNMDDNKLRIMHIYSDDGFEKLGDYPLCTVNEAKELLWEGSYLAYNTANTPTEGDTIVKTELIYLSGIGLEYVMPYYRFVVEFEENGETAYSTCFVPAVRGEYLEKMPSPAQNPVIQGLPK